MKKRKLMVGIGIAVALLIGVVGYLSYHFLLSPKAKLLKALTRTVTDMTEVPSYLGETGLGKSIEELVKNKYCISGTVSLEKVYLDLIKPKEDTQWQLDLIRDPAGRQMKLELLDQTSKEASMLDLLVNDDKVYLKIPEIYDAYFYFSANQIDSQYNESFIGKTLGDFPIENFSINFFPGWTVNDNIVLLILQAYAMDNKAFLLSCYDELEVSVLNENRLEKELEQLPLQENSYTGYEMMIPKEMLRKLFDNLISYEKLSWLQDMEYTNEFKEMIQGDFRANFILDNSKRVVGITFSAGTTHNEEEYEGVVYLAFTGKDNPFGTYTGRLLLKSGEEEDEITIEKQLQDSETEYNATTTIKRIGKEVENLFTSNMFFEKESKESGIMAEVGQVGGIQFKGKFNEMAEGKTEITLNEASAYVLHRNEKTVLLQLRGNVSMEPSKEEIVYPSKYKQLFSLSWLDAILIGKKILNK